MVVVNGLGQEIRGAGLDGLDHISRGGRLGKHDHRLVASSVPHLAQCFQTVLVGHLEIQQYQRNGAIGGQTGQGLLAIFGDRGAISEAPDHHFKVVARVRIVLDDENTLTVSHAFSADRSS